MRGARNTQDEGQDDKTGGFEVIDEVHGFAFFFEQDNSCSQVKANNNQHSIRHI